MPLVSRPSLRRAARRNVRDIVLNTVIAAPAFPRAARWRALRALGARTERSTINGRLFLGGTDIAVGADSFINYDVFIDTSAPVTIGERVAIGPRVTIITGTHDIGGPERRRGESTAAPVVVEDGAWVGASSTILPGVTVGRGAIVGAGAVVTADVEPHTVVAGVPARVVRRLDPASGGPGRPSVAGAP